MRRVSVQRRGIILGKGRLSFGFVVFELGGLVCREPVFNTEGEGGCNDGRDVENEG